MHIHTVGFCGIHPFIHFSDNKCSNLNSNHSLCIRAELQLARCYMIIVTLHFCYTLLYNYTKFDKFSTCSLACWIGLSLLHDGIKCSTFLFISFNYRKLPTSVKIEMSCSSSFPKTEKNKRQENVENSGKNLNWTQHAHVALH